MIVWLVMTLVGSVVGGMLVVVGPIHVRALPTGGAWADSRGAPKEHRPEAPDG